jgi:hypothetical protein
MINRIATEEHCFQQNANVLLTYPPLSCNQIANGCYIYRQGRCQKLHEIATAVAKRAELGDGNLSE